MVDNMLRQEVWVDVVIVGGGIAGLWLLTKIRQAGFTAILLESGALGSGQTYKSQGIIHGGLKYALQGAITQEACVMADMPARWRASLAGSGDIDLSDVRVLSQAQHLFAPNKFTAKLAGFFASKSLTSAVHHLNKENIPLIFQHAAFKGDVYALDEMVLDVPSLILSLVKRNQDVIFKVEPISCDEMHVDCEHNLKTLTIYQNGKALNVHAKQYIFAAGSGNETMVKKWNDPVVAMQRRPLHMVLLKMPMLPTLYAHCLGFGARPRMTITTHFTQNGESIWYVGGALAEEGVTRSPASQIAAAEKEMQAVFPWINFSNAEWATVRVDRAEPKVASGLKPEGSYLKHRNNQLLVWPTKLALAPKLADDVLMHLKTMQFTHEWCDVRALRTWPMPSLSKPVWEEAFSCKSVA